MRSWPFRSSLGSCVHRQGQPRWLLHWLPAWASLRMSLLPWRPAPGAHDVAQHTVTRLCNSSVGCLPAWPRLVSRDS
jgi:hypothetical protein